MSFVRPLLVRPSAAFALLIAMLAAAAPFPALGPRSAQAAPETYEIDPAHSHVGFRIRHLVGKVSGQFNTFAGTIIHDAANPAASSVEVTIDAASIDTNEAKRDGHLQSPDFFDVAKNPQIIFKSRAVKIDGTKLGVEGDLTMHGVTKPVTLAGEVGGTMQGPGGSKRAGFTASTTLNRKEFGIEWNKTFDQGGTLLGDDVAVEIAVEAVQKAPDSGGTK